MLNIKTLKEKQIELENILKELSKKNIKDDQDIKDYIEKLQNIYIKGFRHPYSMFYSLLENIKNDNALYCLFGNIDIIKNKIFDENNENKSNDNEINDESSETESNNRNEFAENIFKLADHLTLEFSRYSRDSRTNSKTSYLEKELDNIKSEAKDIKKNVNTAEKKLSGMQMNIVAIIGIFSGIVLDFSGCMKLLGEAFARMSEAPLPKLTFLILLVGFVLFNTIYLIFGFIGKMNDRPTPWRFNIWFNGAVGLAMITSLAICCFIG